MQDFVDRRKDVDQPCAGFAQQLGDGGAVLVDEMRDDAKRVPLRRPRPAAPVVADEQSRVAERGTLAAFSISIVMASSPFPKL